MNFLKINIKTISFFLSVLLLTFCLEGTLGCLPAQAELDSWNHSSDSRQAIISFVEKVTTSGEFFVEPKNRIAVFDNDGTLWAEKPHYFQEDFIKNGLSKLPESPSSKLIKSKVSKLLKMTEKELDQTGRYPISEEGKIFLSGIQVFSGITTGEYNSLAYDFLENMIHSNFADQDDGDYQRFNTPYIKLTYEPVIELVNYLKENDFKVYICSGGGIYFVRSFSEQAYGIPPEKVMGSAIQTTYDEENKTDGPGGSLVLQQPEPCEITVEPKLFHSEITVEPKLFHNNDQEGKPVGIELFIGKRPLIAVGNSSGDLEMFKYADSGVDKSLIILIKHDDCNREYKYDDVVGSKHSEDGVLVPDNESLEEAQDHDNWIVVSMKNDFDTIFESNPSRTPPTCDD